MKLWLAPALGFLFACAQAPAHARLAPGPTTPTLAAIGPGPSTLSASTTAGTPNTFSQLSAPQAASAESQATPPDEREHEAFLLPLAGLAALLFIARRYTQSRGRDLPHIGRATPPTSLSGLASQPRR